MGLDMYLTARPRRQRIILDKIKQNCPSLVEDIEHLLEVFYKEKTLNVLDWRKAYPINGWFSHTLGGIQNLVKQEVTVEQLAQLLEDAQRVLDDPEQELFPGELEIRPGTFFIEEKLEYTVDGLRQVLEDFDEDEWVFEYEAWW